MATFHIGGLDGIDGDDLCIGIAAQVGQDLGGLDHCVVIVPLQRGAVGVEHPKRPWIMGITFAPINLDDHVDIDAIPEGQVVLAWLLRSFNDGATGAFGEAWDAEPTSALQAFDNHGGVGVLGTTGPSEIMEQAAVFKHDAMPPACFPGEQGVAEWFFHWSRELWPAG